MTSDELTRLLKIEFRLAGKLVQGIVIGRKRKRIAIMTQKDGGWHPVFIPLNLLDHINFQHAGKLFMPIYNPIMEGLLKKARRGETGGW